MVEIAPGVSMQLKLPEDEASIAQIISGREHAP